MTKSQSQPNPEVGETKVPQKTATKAKKTTKKTAKQATPTPGTGKPTSRANLLAAFAKKTAPKAKAPAKKDRPVLQLPEDTVELFEEFCPTKELFDLLEERKSRMASELNAAIWDEYLKRFWGGKAQPQNPGLESKQDGKVDCKGMYIVMARFKINMPPVGEDEDASEVFTQALVDLGLEAEDAANLVENELDFTPTWGVDLTSLMKGSDETAQSAAEKFFLLSQGVTEDENGPLALTPEEWAALGEEINTYRENKGVELKDKANFLNRVCNYCHSVDHLDAVLQLIKPVAYVKGAKCAVSSSTDEKNHRLIASAADILGAELGVE
jgi:hypothetical protein